MKFLKSKKVIIPLPYMYYYVPVIIINLIGLIDSLYLALSHYRNYADIGYQSFCAISRAINCDTVSQSPYSILLNIPVPIWGFIGYAFSFTLILFSWPASGQRKRVWSSIFIVYSIFCVYNFILAGISTFLIHSYCIMCILSYAVCFLILYYAWIIRKRFSCEGIIQGVYQDIIYLSGFPKTSLSIGTLFIGVILLIITLLPRYWHMAPPVLPKDMPRGMTEDGHPWLGAEHPEIVIIEFTDYMCFQCKKMHFHLRRIMQNYPDKIRLVHRHFPMDEKINPIVNEPFHTGAAQLALLAIYGAEKGKFWEVNDILYQQSHTGSIVIKDLSEMTGLDYKEMQRALRERRLRIMLRKDIWEGIKKYGLSGTPGYVIDGHVYLGQIPPEILKKYIK